MRLRSAVIGIFIAAMMPLGAGTAHAQSYVGTWGANPVQCLVNQGLQGAPMIVRRNRYDQHETHCTFVNIRKSGRESWRVRARCTVEGDRQMHTQCVIKIYEPTRPD